MGAGASAAKKRVDRAINTRSYANETMKLAHKALQERPLGCSPVEFTEGFVTVVRASKVAETWMSSIFFNGAPISSVDEIKQLVDTLFDVWAGKTPALFVEMLMWDIRSKLVQVALQIGAKNDTSLTLDEARAIVLEGAQDKVVEKLAEEGKVQEGRGSKIAIKMTNKAVAFAFGKVDDELKESLEEMAAVIKGLYTFSADKIKSNWLKALDPTGSGKLEAHTLANVMLYDNAQRFSVISTDLSAVATTLSEKLNILSTKMSKLPESQIKDPAIAAVRAAGASVAELEKVSNMAAPQVLNMFTFPLAMASPLLPPMPRIAPMLPGKPGAPDPFSDVASSLEMAISKVEQSDGADAAISRVQQLIQELQRREQALVHQLPNSRNQIMRN